MYKQTDTPKNNSLGNNSFLNILQNRAMHFSHLSPYSNLQEILKYSSGSFFSRCTLRVQGRKATISQSSILHFKLLFPETDFKDR